MDAFFWTQVIYLRRLKVLLFRYLLLHATYSATPLSPSFPLFLGKPTSFLLLVYIP